MKRARVSLEACRGALAAASAAVATAIAAPGPPQEWYDALARVDTTFEAALTAVVASMPALEPVWVWSAGDAPPNTVPLPARAYVPTVRHGPPRDAGPETIDYAAGFVAFQCTPAEARAADVDYFDTSPDDEFGYEFNDGPALARVALGGRDMPWFPAAAAAATCCDCASFAAQAKRTAFGYIEIDEELPCSVNLAALEHAPLSIFGDDPERVLRGRLLDAPAGVLDALKGGSEADSTVTSTAYRSSERGFFCVPWAPCGCGA